MRKSSFAHDDHHEHPEVPKTRVCMHNSLQNRAVVLTDGSRDRGNRRSKPRNHLHKNIKRAVSDHLRPLDFLLIAFLTFEELRWQDCRASDHFVRPQVLSLEPQDGPMGRLLPRQLDAHCRPSSCWRLGSCYPTEPASAKSGQEIVSTSRHSSTNRSLCIRQISVRARRSVHGMGQGL